MPKRSRKCGKGGRKNKSKKQKLYNMKGCSKSATKSARMTKSATKGRSRTLKGGQGCGAPGCPIPAFSWKQMQQQGGSCSTCGLTPPMTGGSFYKPASPIPGPFVGQAWSPSIADWPGVNGIGGDSNYLANNLYKADPQTMMQLGGKRMNKRKKRKSLRGGGLLPQD